MDIDIKNMYTVLDYLRKVFRYLDVDNIEKRIKEFEEEINNETFSYEKAKESIVFESGMITDESFEKRINDIEDNQNQNLLRIKNVLGYKISKRDKLLLLIGYFEPYLIESLNIKPSLKLREKAKEEIISKMNETCEYAYSFLQIVCLVYRRGTGEDTCIIDKRIPYRNAILHKGMNDYTDIEIECAYKMLISFIFIIYTQSKKLYESRYDR